MRSVSLLLIGLLALTATSDADAATRRRATRARPVVAAAPAPQQPYYAPYNRQRGYDIYARRPGEGGPISWNTPNADGNLGNPYTGGGGGGP